MCSDGSLNACALYGGQGGHAVHKVATQAAHRAAPDPPWRGCHICASVIPTRLHEHECAGSRDMWLRSVVGSAADRYHMHDDWASFCLCVPRRCHTSTAMACGMLGHRPSGCTWVVLSGRNRRHCFCLSPFAMPRICCFLRAALPQSWQRVRSRRHMHTYVLLCARVTSKTTKKTSRTSHQAQAGIGHSALAHAGADTSSNTGAGAGSCPGDQG